MKQVLTRLKPKKGFSHIIHVMFTALIPVLTYVFIRTEFDLLAVAVVVLSKWRILSVRPRFWPANVRANAVDLIIGLSTIVFMTNTNDNILQLFFTGIYIVWQVFIKPNSSVIGVAVQSFVGQAYGLSALFIGWGDSDMLMLIMGTWVVAYLSARHYFTSYDEPYSSLYAHSWGYFAASLAWLSSHWLVFYSVVAQPALLLSAIGFSLGSFYYLHETDRLSVFYRRQILAMMMVVILIVLVASDWGDKAV
jgi:hypothetical protein